MKPHEDRVEVFPGMVKYGGYSGSIGSVKWKVGAIVIVKDDKHGLKIEMKLDCSEIPILSYPLTADSLKKYVCKDTILIDVKGGKSDKDLISFYLKACDKHAAKRIGALCNEVLTKNTAEPACNSKVCTNTTPAMSNLFTDMGNPSPIVKIEKEIPPQTFMRSYSKSSDQFLQRNSDKSRQFMGTLSSSSTSFIGKSAAQPHYSSTPRWFYSKRGPGLMPEPSTIKRPRLIDSIAHSMQMKPAQPTETNHQQALQGHTELSRMKPNVDRVEVFPGMVKYGGCSGSIGSVMWKTGAIVIDKDDKHGWKIKMKLDCSETPILSYPFTPDTLKKYVCKDTILIDLKRSKGNNDLISLYLKASDKRAAKQIEALCMEVLTENTTGSGKRPDTRPLENTPGRQKCTKRPMANTPGRQKCTKRPMTNTPGRQKCTKRDRGDKEGDLHALERKRRLLEIEVLEQKKIHDQQLFLLQKRILEKQLN